MKKIFAILLALTLLLLSSCGNAQQSDVITIKPTEFSAETQKVLELFDNETVFFDISVDETVKSQEIIIWVYKDGEWVQNGRTYGNVKSPRSQIAIRLTDTAYDLYEINENGHSKYSYPEIETDFSSSTSISSRRITSPTPIVLNEEIPLWVKLGTDKNSLSVRDNFREADCNAGIAFTVTFSDKEAK